MSASSKSTKTLSLKKPVEQVSAMLETEITAQTPDSTVVAEKTPVEPPVASKEIVKVPKSNKMMVATVIFERMTKEGKARKEIIQAFVAEAGLTLAGSSTYFQTIKSKSKKDK